MRSVVIFKQYSSDVSQYDAHIYEHLFLFSFEKYASQFLSIDPSVIGYSRGETVDGYVFIESWFYDRRLFRLFKKFLKFEHLDMSAIEAIKSSVRAEDGGQPDTSIIRKLKKNIEILRSTPWQPIQVLSPTLFEKSAYPNIQKSKKEFKSLLVTSYVDLNSLTIEDRALLQRLQIFIDNTISDYIRHSGGYCFEYEPSYENDTYFHTSIKASLPIVYMSNKQLEDRLENQLHSYDLEKNYPYIKQHLKHFSIQPTWQGSVIDKLNRLSILVSNKQIYKLTTEKRLHHILQQVEVRVETISRRALLEN